MLIEGIDTMLAGDVETGKAILRDYINAAVGFKQLAEATHIPAKSLMRMFGPKGNPRADNLFQIVWHLQTREGIRLEVGQSQEQKARDEIVTTAVRHPDKSTRPC
jgi:DNA-binding phage protein